MRSAVRRIPAIMIIFLIAGVILMPVSTPRWSALAAEPIKLGEVGPLSPPGDYANGALMKNAAEIATDEINAAGGVLGRQVTVSYQDSRGMPEEGTAVAERLVSQEHVSAIFGEYHSSVFLAEMEVAHKNNVPIVAVDVWALKITGKGYPEVFRVAPNQALIASKYGDWLAAAGFKNIAILYEKTDGGQSHLDVLLPALDKHGIKYDAVGVDPNQTDFTPQIVRFKNHTPPYDFFASVYSEAGAYNMISQLRGSKILEGSRGQPPVDRKALAGCIERMSQLAMELEGVRELDVNPLVAFERGCRALDARIIIG